jgi:aspartate/methionine/tyrosine aminotransferase
VFAARTGWDLTPNPLADRIAARRRSGAPLCDLTIANPTRVGLAYDTAAILAALANPLALEYAPAPIGLGCARDAVARDHARRGVAVDPSRIVLTASTSEAYSFLFKLLCDPGDAVLVPQPSYPLFEYLAGLESVRVRPYPLVYHRAHGFRMDLDALREAASDGGARAIVVVHPNNPTGSFLQQTELSTLRAIGLPVISDEVFLEYAYAPDAARCPSLAGETELVAFALGGLSKSCGLPQLKLGWIAVAGPAAQADAALGRLELISDTFLSVGTPVQLAAERLLQVGGRVRAQIQERIGKNRSLLEGAFGPASPAEVLRSNGGWYGVVRLPRTQSEEEWVLELVTEAGVLVHPGYFFDFPEEAYIVVSLLPEVQVLARALEQVARRVKDERE